MKRALVTGAKGFAGAWLTKALLEAGAEVVCLDRIGADPERTTTLKLLGLGDEVEDARRRSSRRGIRRRGRRRRIDTIFHLAAETIVGTVQASPAEGFDTNVRGTWTVLEAARANGVERVVVASSDKAYGAHDELPYREHFALQPTAPYEASKAAADLISRSYWHSYGVPGRGHPLREYLRRRRSELLPAGARGGLRGDRGPLTGAALRRLAGPGLPLRRGRRRGLPGARPATSIAPACAARRSTPAARSPTRCSRSSRR